MEEKYDYDSDLAPESKPSAMFNTRARHTLRWDTVNFSAAHHENILSHCWGQIESGTVTAVMGPSGSGKSSLLNILAGRIHRGATGRFLVDSFQIVPSFYQKSFAYVLQHDSLVPTETPREALTFSAMLRLPRDIYKPNDIKNIVSHTLQALGIEHCADTLIGNAFIKGLSGGERKRTSVGIELITSPSLIFLDEPISGLDSYNGYKLITLLKRIAASNAAILLTIHQPSSEIFYLFDRVIFLKEGQVLYEGTAMEVTDYFTSRGFSFPPHHNPADTVMFLCEMNSVDDLKERKVFQIPPQDTNIGAHLVTINLEDGGSSMGTDGSESLYGIELMGSHGSLLPDRYRTGAALGYTQLYTLSQRGIRSTIRNTPALLSRFGVVAVIGLVMSLIFINAGRQDDSVVENINAHYGAVTLVMISTMFNSAMPALMEVPMERNTFSREYASGTYSVWAYSIAKLFVDIPLAFLQALIQCLIVYYIIGFQGNLFYIILTVWITALTSSALAVMIGCLVVDSKQAVEMTPLVFPPQILFAGFFISTSLIPVWLRWLQWLCPLKYGMSLFLVNEFAPRRDSCADEAAEPCANILSSNNIEENDKWLYSVALMGLFVGFRVLASVALIAREGGSRRQ